MGEKKLSIIIPVYNESKTIQHILNEIKKVKLINEIKKEIIIVNDGSEDDTEEKIMEFIKTNKELEIKYFKHQKNQGKGAAIRTGIMESTGDYLIIQDADLEYDPNEYNLLLKPVFYNRVDVVYGSRFRGNYSNREFSFFHSIGNKFLTFLSNLFTNLNFTDIETCYKLFRAEIIRNINIEEDRFGFESEITAKVSKIPDIRIHEVGISYYGRTYKEGKKINWKDGFRAIYCILKYNLFSR